MHKYFVQIMYITEYGFVLYKKREGFKKVDRCRDSQFAGWVLFRKEERVELGIKRFSYQKYKIS